MSTLAKIANPFFVRRKVRQHGLGRVILDTTKRTGLPLALGQAVSRTAKIGLSPLDYASRRLGAPAFVKRAAPQYSIPEGLAYRRMPAGTVPGSDRVMETCKRIYAERLPEVERMGGRYGINLLASDRESWSRGTIDLRKVPELLDFALSDQLLGAATAYLGEIPVLGEMQLYVTTPMETNVGNNFYHFDKPYSRQLKFWLAIEDIDAGKGPFTFLPAPASKIVREKVRYNGRMTDEEVYAAVPEREKVEFLGSAGDGLWVDTCRCAHFGSRTRKGNRIMLLLEYITRFYWAEPTFYFVPTLYDSARYSTDPVRRKALDLVRSNPPGEGHLAAYE